MTIRMHKKIKITVLRTEYDQELAEQYAIPNLEMCPFHHYKESAMKVLIFTKLCTLFCTLSM